MAAAARRSITAGASIITRRFCPSCCHLLLPNHSTSNDEISKSQPQPQPPSHFKPTTNFFHLDPFARFYSSSSSSSSDEVGFITDVAEVLKDPTTEIASSVVNTVPISFPGEVAAAAADSAIPVAALQHVIDFVHSTTGFNWWASIALTTLLIRGATVPLMLNQMKASYKLAAMRPEMEELKERMGNVKEMDPAEMMENQKKMKALFKKHGVNPFSPLKGLLIQGPVFISFFFAISNMVEKVPSFKAGGAFWFTDLTTPDPFYALPILTGLTFLATVELNVQEGMEGNPMAGTMKKFSRGMAVMTVPFTAQFPKAIFCYWITSNLFSLLYGSVMKQKRVRQFLKLPDMDHAPANPSTQPSSGMFSFFDGQKSIAAPIIDEAKEPSKVPERRISSSTVISQRIRSLEKQVKSRNNSKTKRR